MDLRTEFRKQKDAKDQEVYEDYERLMAKPGAMKAEVERVIMKRHNIHSRATVWSIRKRVKNRLAAETQKQEAP